ncbi:2-methoxy-6-polyprenyl-1,4-benzoquinol methylase, mitochondrial [Eumeta japonica]|uniref:2-methoxy-6-polyprenyl-1,4-benzoquinol methylase, mitochondrial n=1 Tax=Eumeta variegata TaxID=151549 RepID=A0A4C1U358_EUMVA|nr:2-methoxy-6-polyprenyl-1,4-benzoquinol methylase, mitochondrial [Eumeta japonica]
MDINDFSRRWHPLCLLAALVEVVKAFGLTAGAICFMGYFKNGLRFNCVQEFSTETFSKTQDSEKPKQTHFGFQSVDEEDKWKKVHEVFETVAGKYDVMNDAMSLGIHRLWKDTLMLRLAPTHGTRLLDVAGGTGDITFRYINFLKNLGPIHDGKQSSVTVCDINQSMLDVGKLRAQRQGFTKERYGVDIEWLCGDAEHLPLPDDSYSAYTIAFGIRNCTHIDKVNKRIYDQYSFQVIPALGQLIAGQWKPYQYLVESIRQFPQQERFKSMIEEAGFRQLRERALDIRVNATSDEVIPGIRSNPDSARRCGILAGCSSCARVLSNPRSGPHRLRPSDTLRPSNPNRSKSNESTEDETKESTFEYFSRHGANMGHYITLLLYIYTIMVASLCAGAAATAGPSWWGEPGSVTASTPARRCGRRLHAPTYSCGPNTRDGRLGAPAGHTYAPGASTIY